LLFHVVDALVGVTDVGFYCRGVRVGEKCERCEIERVTSVAKHPDGPRHDVIEAAFAFAKK
jgi:hypothetical protein